MSGGINFKLDTVSGTVGNYDSNGIRVSFNDNWNTVYQAFGSGESGQDIICVIGNSSRLIYVFALAHMGNGAGSTWYVNKAFGCGTKYFKSYEINVIYS